MNLQSEITEVRSRIAHPYRLDSADSYVLDDEIANWIWQGEIRVSQSLHYEALFSLQIETTATTTTGTENYTLASIITGLNYTRILGITYSPDGVATKRRNCLMLQPKEFQQAKSNPLNNRIANWDEPYATIINNSVFVIPAPILGAANCLGVRYLWKPSRRYKKFRGSVTSVSGATKIYDTDAAALGVLDDHFNNCGYLFTSGPESGEFGTISDYVTATGEFTLNPGAGGSTVSTHTVGAEFEIGQVSDLSEDLWTLYIQWATYLAKMKDAGPEGAEPYRAVYDDMVKVINSNWQGPLQEVVE